ncbi:hypothetical protein CROQUDRAFT_135797 [Cronartium quercuum f. sp. fusiforme G11]|uniref:Uncharacterized protein n=1 Tax=Cronartium quercuum f. sp. fusiforme G11 TaxID=708437 RepID=A0A9P6T7I4_9BASI|nr:hypothetical protein CROQUDRAFT_135797 [Cronartium quercuum f. sp. fusiforme G11]
MTAVVNPGWMSIVLMVFILAHFSILIFSALVLAYHLRRKDWFLVTRQRNGLLKPNRTLVEALGAFSYAALSLVDMSCQLYIDYQRKPVRGKILIFAWRYPIAWLAFWCIMWNCITGRIRAIWDPTFRDASEGGYDSMPKWVVWLLNSIFVFFVGVFTIIDPAVLIPAHISHDQFLNTLRGVENALLTASKAPDALSYSLTKLYTILEPLDSIPTTINQLAASVKVYYYFSAVLDFGMMAVYAVFIFLTYRQYRVLRNHEKTGRVTDNVDQVLKFDYKAELKTIFVEAVFIFFMLFSFIPMFAWGLTTNGSNQFLTSPTSVTVPALTLGAAAAIVGNV